MKKLALYNHGQDSEPWGSKPLALAEVAKRHGYIMESPDYRKQPDPDARVEQLLAMDLSEYDDVVLIGSSMGAYVATVAAEELHPRGLFLLAPAFYLPGYQRTEFNPPSARTLVIHGWQDTIVAPENAWKFCRRYHIRLNMLDTEHRLISEMPRVCQEFEHFLDTLATP